MANPKGRPRKVRAGQVARAILDRNSADIMEVLVKAAKDGNLMAAKLCVERMLAVARQETVSVNLPASNLPEELNDQHAAILESVAAGDLTPETAHLISRILEARRRTYEATDVAQRLTALEDRLNERGKH